MILTAVSSPAKPYFSLLSYMYSYIMKVAHCMFTYFFFSYKPLCLINQKPFNVMFSVLFLKACPMLYSLYIYSDPVLIQSH